MGDSPTYRTKAFISYSHADKAYLEQLQKHLKFYVRESNIKVWDDTQIQPGAKWQEAIERALAEAQVAILLVSVDFLASDFVANVELPRLLAAARAGEMTILPVILGYCGFERSKLDQFQSVNDPRFPGLLSRQAKWAGIYYEARRKTMDQTQNNVVTDRVKHATHPALLSAADRGFEQDRISFFLSLPVE